MRFLGISDLPYRHLPLSMKTINHEVHLKRIAGPFHEPFFNFHSSPLGLIPKHNPGKSRLIHNLCFPKGDSINSYTSREFTKVQYGA